LTFFSSFPRTAQQPNNLPFATDSGALHFSLRVLTPPTTSAICAYIIHPFVSYLIGAALLVSIKDALTTDCAHPWQLPSKHQI
jgi:hypothetical protein